MKKLTWPEVPDRLRKHVLGDLGAAAEFEETFDKREEIVDAYKAAVTALRKLAKEKTQ